MASFPERAGFGSFFGRTLGRIIARWRRWVSPDRYRPEKHYMRGPGPKASGKAGDGKSPAS
jgi:hypothetical protein